MTGGRELAGVSVLVTRDESELHNGGLTARIKAAGGRAVAAPTVVIAAAAPARPPLAAPHHKGDVHTKTRVVLQLIKAHWDAMLDTLVALQQWQSHALYHLF